MHNSDGEPKKSKEKHTHTKRRSIYGVGGWSEKAGKDETREREIEREKAIFRFSFVRYEIYTTFL